MSSRSLYETGTSHVRSAGAGRRVTPKRDADSVTATPGESVRFGSSSTSRANAAGHATSRSSMTMGSVWVTPPHVLSVRPSHDDVTGGRSRTSPVNMNSLTPPWNGGSIFMHRKESRRRMPVTCSWTSSPRGRAIIMRPPSWTQKAGDCSPSSQGETSRRSRPHSRRSPGP